MHPLRLSAFFLALGLILPYRNISASEIGKIVEETRQLYESIDDLRMHFRQRRSSDFFSRTDSSEGEILIKEPNRFVLRERRQEIVCDGETLWTYNKIDSQVIKSVCHSGAPFVPRELLRRIGDECELVGSGAVGGRDCYLIALDSLPQMGVWNLMLWVDKENYVVRKLSYHDSVDNKSEFLFDSIGFNVGLKDEEFEFVVPPEVEIIDW